MTSKIGASKCGATMASKCAVEQLIGKQRYTRKCMREIFRIRHPEYKLFNIASNLKNSPTNLSSLEYGNEALQQVKYL